ncbi:unnamed protein product [Rhizoctonia solani]|uniref:G domain-containing protein n=1 Tax=Rhizoctonia solani TaxID=456999 RepID=A0A8H3A144_9AGAM|nr:unnamed protein product [Rhizoctonia solani]
MGKRCRSISAVLVENVGLGLGRGAWSVNIYWFTLQPAHLCFCEAHQISFLYPDLRLGLYNMDRFAPSEVPEPHYIALYGGTGVGKSTFVNDASGTGSMLVGHDLPSCTNEVVASETFTVDGEEIVLFDTPGFDDTTISDADTLKRIAEFLETMYRRGIKLKGIVYLHRITDMRMTGASARTYRLLRSLCGAKNLSNVVIVTNMWSDPPTEDELLREQQLKSVFFKSALDDGAQLMRREHPDQRSAHAVLRALLPRAAIHPQLPIELGEGISLQDTEAGRIVKAEIEAKLSKQDGELQELRDEIRALVEERNLKAQRELDQYRERKEREMLSLRAQLASLTMEIEEGRRFWEAQFEDMRARRIQAMRLAEDQGDIGRFPTVGRDY